MRRRSSSARGSTMRCGPRRLQGGALSQSTFRLGGRGAVYSRMLCIDAHQSRGSRGVGTSVCRHRGRVPRRWFYTPRRHDRSRACLARGLTTFAGSVDPKSLRLLLSSAASARPSPSSSLRPPRLCGLNQHPIALIGSLAGFASPNERFVASKHQQWVEWQPRSALLCANSLAYSAPSMRPCLCYSWSPFIS